MRKTTSKRLWLLWLGTFVAVLLLVAVLLIVTADRAKFPTDYIEIPRFEKETELLVERDETTFYVIRSRYKDIPVAVITRYAGKERPIAVADYRDEVKHLDLESGHVPIMIGESTAVICQDVPECREAAEFVRMLARPL